MTDYLERAAQVLSDPSQTSIAKHTAAEILLNAGFTTHDISAFSNCQSGSPLQEYMVFTA